MDLTKYLLLFNTVKYLKPIQIYYRLYYIMRAKIRGLKHFSNTLLIPAVVSQLELIKSIESISSFDVDQFKFLNRIYLFGTQVDWNFSKLGKLWTYNLTYFDFLNQQEIGKENGLKLINDFIRQLNYIKDGVEPFPISLRTINWIKFLTQNAINDKKINDSLFAQYQILMDNIEYHLLGNHLLENGFSLLFGAYYFQDEKFYVKAKKILTEELEEQILRDGAHFELSPMYHQIILFRVLDCINLIQHNYWKNQELLGLLNSKAKIMLEWLNTITYENGDIPLLNDSANKIAPTTKQLNEYASALNLKLNIAPSGNTLEIKNSKLSDSGYRKIRKGRYEMVIDVGNIGPDYIPGHAHSDTFNFELYIDKKPFIVDTGLSTYNTNRRRILERSTASHNTVEIDGRDQSEVWGAFRVAKRAKITSLKEGENYMEATHDGYKHIKAFHTRKFITLEDIIVIEDNIDGSKKHKGNAYLHFYPGIVPRIKGNKIILLNTEITVYNAGNLKIDEYQYASEFNKLIDAYYVKILFSDQLKMEIKI